MRIVMIDGFRGFFLFFMMIIHANMLLRAVAGKLNHHYFGWVEDAQGFVFISGMVVALVYGRIKMRQGDEAMGGAIRKRMRTIYSHQAGLILILLAVALFTQAAFGFTSPSLQIYTREPVGFALASLLLVTGSNHMGILPMYIIFMSVMPLVLRLMHRGYLMSLLTVSVLLWLAAQSGLGEYLVAQAEAALAAKGVTIPLGIYFNPLGWQVLFFSGAFFGYLMSVGRLDLSMFDRRDAFFAFLIGLVGFLALGVYDRLAFGALLPPDVIAAIMAPVNRGNLSILYVVTFALDLFLVVWLVRAGRECGVRMAEIASRFVTWFFTRPALVFLGQHSLHVFSAHILVFYALDLLLMFYRPGTLAANVIVLLTPLPLYAAAWGHASWTRMQKGRLSLGSGAA